MKRQATLFSMDDAPDGDLIEPRVATVDAVVAELLARPLKSESW